MKNSSPTLNEMEKRLALGTFGPQLWTRDLARKIRAELNEMLENAAEGSLVVIDAASVEVFDYSFANELFGKTLLSLPNEYRGKFLAVENLSPYTRENLIKALESLGIAMIERKKKRLELIGKIHPAYSETFSIMTKAKEPITVNFISEKLEINITAASERLTKLVNMGLARREKATSGSGREQFTYTTVS
jgi:hypothetical protein